MKRSFFRKHLQGLMKLKELQNRRCFSFFYNKSGNVSAVHNGMSDNVK